MSNADRRIGIDGSCDTAARALRGGNKARAHPSMPDAGNGWRGQCLTRAMADAGQCRRGRWLMPGNAWRGRLLMPGNAWRGRWLMPGNA
jgi:hypothetical protein